MTQQQENNDYAQIGHKEDDPDIAIRYSTDEEAKKAVTTSEFGRKGTSNRSIVKDKTKIGFRRTYNCDNKVSAACKKVIRIVHVFNERDGEGQKIFRIESKGEHSGTCDLAAQVRKKVKL